MPDVPTSKDAKAFTSGDRDLSIEPLRGSDTPAVGETGAATWARPQQYPVGESTAAPRLARFG